LHRTSKRLASARSEVPLCQIPSHALPIQNHPPVVFSPPPIPSQRSKSAAIKYQELVYELGEVVRVRISRAERDNWVRSLEIVDGPLKPALLAAKIKLSELTSAVAPDTRQAVEFTKDEVRARLKGFAPLLAQASWNCVSEDLRFVETQVVQLAPLTTREGIVRLAGPQPVLSKPSATVFTALIEDGGSWYRFCGRQLSEEFIREAVITGDRVRISYLGFASIDKPGQQSRHFNRFSVNNLSRLNGSCDEQ